MADKIRRVIRRTVVIYWMMLLYIIAALVWWFISLDHQNHQLADLNRQNLVYRSNTSPGSVSPLAEKQINEQARRNTAKYIAEGVTFLILICIGAIFVYRSVRRQLKLQQQQQNFMMAVTHELKTPISVVRLNLETLKKYDLDPLKQKKLTQATIDETGRLNFLTNNILIASQLDGDGYQSTREEIDLGDLLKDCIRDFRNRFPDRIFEENIVSDAELKGDPLLLQMLINNLVENAIKYSPRESPVKASLQKNQNNLELQIIDEGPGIEPGERKKIFSKFYRVGNELTRRTQGTGLGLYLCRKIARDHNADISVTNHLTHGSKFVVVFHT